MNFASCNPFILKHTNYNKYLKKKSKYSVLNATAVRAAWSPCVANTVYSPYSLVKLL